MTEYKNIKFKTNLPYVVRLKYDEPKEKTGEYGDYWIYGVEYEGEDYTFIANFGLNTLLSQHKKGDLVEIMKIEDDDNKTHFEVEPLSEKDIKSAVLEKSPGKAEIGPDWDRITATKDHKILIQVAMKLAVQSLPAKVKLVDKDYDEIEVRMVKFNAIMNKYLGVVMPEQKPKFPPLVQAKWNEFDKYLEENKEIEKYKEVRDWLDGLTDPTTKVLTEQLSKLKETLQGEYESYHESLITGCCEILKTKDRLPIIQTLDNMVKAWGIDGVEKLSETSENQCLNLVDEFDKLQKDEQDSEVPY